MWRQSVLLAVSSFRMEAMAAGDYPLQDQVGLLAGREPKHAPKIFKEDMKVDWTLGVDAIFNHIRGLSPFPTGKSCR